MKSNIVERIILGAGAIVLLGYGATLLIPSFHSYGDLFRLLAIAAIACYALYSFWIQNMDQKDLQAVAQTGVDFISIGALTNSIYPLDISLKFK